MIERGFHALVARDVDEYVDAFGVTKWEAESYVRVSRCNLAELYHKAGFVMTPKMCARTVAPRTFLSHVFPQIDAHVNSGKVHPFLLANRFDKKKK